MRCPDDDSDAIPNRIRFSADGGPFVRFFIVVQVDVFECTVEGDNLTCTCRYTTDDDTTKAKKGFHDLEVRFLSCQGFVISSQVAPTYLVPYDAITGDHS